MLPLTVIVTLAIHAVLAPQNASPPSRELYDKAVRLQHDGNEPGALSLLWEAAGLAPHDGEIQNRLGEALERIGALDAAVDAYRSAADAHPAPHGVANNLVLALVKSGRSAEAVMRARAAASNAPRDAERWFTLGLAQADVDSDGAIDSFQRALALDGRHALARYNLALVLFHADRLQTAIEQLRRALAIQPRPEIHYTLGAIYRHQGNLDRAADALRDAVAANPSYADAWLALGSVMKARGDLTSAKDALDRAVLLRPASPEPRGVLAQTLAAAGDTVGASRQFAEAERLRSLQQQSQEAATLTAVGTQKLDADDAAGAVECFTRAIQAFEPFAPAHYQLGRALDRLGRHDAARAAFARAQQLNPALAPPR
jgi:tetratricopeptide (TPR) repeat protein